MAVPSLIVHAEVYDFQLHRLFEQTKTVDVAADDSQRVINIPAGIFQPANSIHFVRLELKEQTGKVVSRNFYWIPTPLTNFDWSDPDTPAKSLENMQALRRLPKSRVRGTLTIMGRELRVHLETPSEALAFQVQLATSSADGKPVTPMLWSDDFIELMPGEHRDLTAMLPEKYAGAAPSIAVTGWNIDPLTLALETPHPKLNAH